MLLTTGHDRTESLIRATWMRHSYTPNVRQSGRLGAILERLSNGGSVAVIDLSRELGVSTATVRRDLQLLEEQRLLARTHRGAIAQGLGYELPLRYHGPRHQDE